MTNWTYVTTFGPAIVIAAGSIIAAVITERNSIKRKSAKPDAKPAPVTRSGYVLISGFLAASLVMVVTVGLSQLAIDKKVSRLSIDKPLTLLDFPRTPTDIKSHISALDKDAAAILRDGAGPREWQTAEETLRVGDVFYVPAWVWVDQVFPHRESSRTEDKSCVLKAKAKLTIRGFSRERNSALVEYTAPGDAAGSSCGTGTLFYYRVPTRSK